MSHLLLLVLTMLTIVIACAKPLGQEQYKDGTDHKATSEFNYNLISIVDSFKNIIEENNKFEKLKKSLKGILENVAKDLNEAVSHRINNDKAGRQKHEYSITDSTLEEIEETLENEHAEIGEETANEIAHTMNKNYSWTQQKSKQVIAEFLKLFYGIITI
ncbi:unnamed protein product [Parnassius apollo]|uniref:(apollo) hypothetical protein n=1 Tax=Parnassius apollo TaxID=110799 RepID=A0A8S3X3E2_PARAO|nr:unnamed protein product [Parnassius apollo]